MRIAGIVLCALAAGLTTSCNMTGSIDKAIAQLQQTTQTIAAQSDAWRAALPKLVDQLNQLEAQATADTKGVISDTTNQVQALANESITYANINAQEIIAKTGVEFRCNTDFAMSGITARLQYLIDDLKFWQTNKRHTDQKPLHGICQIINDTLPLYTTANNRLGIDSSKLVLPNIVEVFGYNFRGDALPKLQLMDSNGNRIRDVTVTPAYVTQYQLTLDFSTETFAGVTPGSRIQFLWPDKGDPNTLTLSLLNPGKLKITNAAFDPAAPIVSKDAVFLTVTILNQGDVPSGNYVVNWTPQGDRVQAVSQPALNAKQSRTMRFPNPYTYQTIGQNSNNVSLSTGDDSETYSITVVTNVASVQDYTINEPVVTKPWSPTSISVLPGDKVEIMDAGGCVNTGGSGPTTKLYVDPQNKSCSLDNNYYGTIAIPGTIEEAQKKSIREFWQADKFVKVNRASTIELGYVDDSYGDNGYWGMGDTGTCDQCKGHPNAYVKIRVTHYK